MTRLKKVFDSERAWKVYAAIIFGLILAAIIGVSFWMRHSAPCWIFPLAEAPSRCLVVNPR